MNPMVLERVERLQPRVVLLAAAGVLVVTLLAAWFLLIGPPLGKFRTLSAEHDASALEVAGLEASVDQQELDRLYARVEHLEQVLQAGRDGASANEMMAIIIGTLDRLAGVHGVRLAGVRPGQSATVLSFEEQPFEIEANGRFFDLIAWLRAAERELRPMLLKRFRFRAADSGDGLAVTVSVVSYRVLEPAS